MQVDETLALLAFQKLQRDLEIKEEGKEFSTPFYQRNLSVLPCLLRVHLQHRLRQAVCDDSPNVNA